MKIPRRTMKTGVPTLAMGDIAFTVLIFFVILARADDDSHLVWDPAKTPKVEKAGFARVKVVVTKPAKANDPPQVYLNGREIGITGLAQEIEKLLGNAPKGERTVFLKIHKTTQAATFEPIIEAVSEAGGELVHVLEEER